MCAVEEGPRIDWLRSARIGVAIDGHEKHEGTRKGGLEVAFRSIRRMRLHWGLGAQKIHLPHTDTMSMVSGKQEA